ncbi:UNVERIFIED_CONTAM: Magnesium transporter MRS2-3 [Sesamum latifolium]|uniref:Magnesium transporter n=1 Tax=Sesamum latifolium TaxID=2727402 RepID=A0AAW2UL38_9LAMI
MRPAAAHHAAPPPGGSGEPPLRPAPGGHRKKGASVRAWLTVDSTGEAQVVEAGKHAIMRRTGLPGRDLRILDPVLSYPSTVLGRERAIVVNLEHIKAIITAQEVLFLNSTDPLVTPFVKKLQGIFRHRQAEKAPQEAGVDGNNVEWANLYNLQAPQSMAVAPHLNFQSTNEEGNADGEQQVAENARGLKLLPFEFVALEACLEAACSSLDNEVRDELEHLLDDDDDMAEMYLTDKFELQQLENSSASSINEQDGIVEEVAPPYLENRHVKPLAPVENLMGCDGNSIVSDADIQETDDQQEQNIGESNTFRRHSHRTHTSTHSATSKNLDVEELEMILEAYFVQIDGTLNKLSTLREYVDDTEDYINIMLDDKQNHLLQMGVVLSTATVVVSAFVALTGVFGMNITIELFDSDKAGMPEFLWTVGGGTMGCLFLYVAAIAWCKHKRLLE